MTEFQARFPLTEHLWLTAGEACRVTVCDTVTMVRSGDPWAGLMDFHRALLDEIGRIQDREARRRWAELQDAVAGEQELVRGLSERLAAVANEGTLAIPQAMPSGDHLLAACRAVGRELGLEIRPPRKRSDDAEDGVSLGEIARANGIHVRQVTLPHDWSKERGEPAPGPALRR